MEVSNSSSGRDQYECWCTLRRKNWDLSHQACIFCKSRECAKCMNQDLFGLTNENCDEPYTESVSSDPRHRPTAVEITIELF